MELLVFYHFLLLRITSKKKILTLTQINVIIFEVDITDKSIYNNLIVGNPNILVFNDSIIDFNKKVRIFNTVMGLRFYIHHLLSDNEEMKMLKKSNQNYKNIKNKNKSDSHSLRDMLLEKKFKIKHRNMTNPKCSEIINFLTDIIKFCLICLKIINLNLIMKP